MWLFCTPSSISFTGGYAQITPTELIITTLCKTPEPFPKSKWITLVLVLQFASALLLSHFLVASSSCLIPQTLRKTPEELEIDTLCKTSIKSLCITPEEFTVHNPRIHPGEWKSRKTKLRRSFPKLKQILLVLILQWVYK